MDFNHHQAEGDANLLICKTVVDSASRRTTILIGDDTDLLVLLCFHPKSFNLYLRSEAKRPLTELPVSGTNRKLRIWNILAAESTRPRNMPLPFIHNITGYGTTSRLLGVGKGEQLRKSWELIVTSKNKLKYSMEKLQRMRSFQLVKKSWFACMGPIWERLDALCYRQFWEKVAARTSFVQVHVHTLPPTAATADPVYYQINQTHL